MFEPLKFDCTDHSKCPDVTVQMLTLHVFSFRNCVLKILVITLKKKKSFSSDHSKAVSLLLCSLVGGTICGLFSYSLFLISPSFGGSGILSCPYIFP